MPRPAGLAGNRDHFVARADELAKPLFHVIAQSKRLLLLGDCLNQLPDTDDWLIADTRMPDVVENLLQAIVNDQKLPLTLIELVFASIAAATQFEHLLVTPHDLLHFRR